jgi:hypothetical protein
MLNDVYQELVRRQQRNIVSGYDTRPTTALQTAIPRTHAAHSVADCARLSTLACTATGT